MTGPDPRRATIFGSYAEQYDRWRPGYPPEAVDWLLPPGAARVADVGAGTGKLTGPLLERGLDVVAVEPDEGMLGVLRRRYPTAETYGAPAEALPLADASVDAVLVATAWHWFSHDLALREVRRVLRPGGRLGLAWNSAAVSDGWPGDIARLDPDHRVGDPSPLAVSGFDADLVTARFDWDWPVSPEHVRAYLGTHSGYAVLDPTERERRLDTAERIVADECRRVGAATVAWPCTTWCYRWEPAD